MCNGGGGRCTESASSGTGTASWASRPWVWRCAPLTEQLAAQLQPEIARYQDALTPAIILIPGKEGSLGIGMANIKTAVERAVGADIL